MFYLVINIFISMQILILMIFNDTLSNSIFCFHKNTPKLLNDKYLDKFNIQISVKNKITFPKYPP